MSGLDEYLHDYFEARPQLQAPPWSSVVGYAVPAPWRWVIESLLEERRAVAAKIEQCRITLKRIQDQAEIEGAYKQNSAFPYIANLASDVLAVTTKNAEECESKHVAAAMGNRPCKVCGADNWVATDKGGRE